MNHYDLFEQYLHALRQDPHAAPPSGLGAELAAFARKLTQQAAVPTAAARRRMWERALLQSHMTPNGYHKELENMNFIDTHPAPEKRKNKRPSLTLIAAGFAAVCIAIFAMLPKDMLPIFSAAPIAQQQTTPTPVMPMVFTEAAPIAQEPMFATATAIIADATRTAAAFGIQLQPTTVPSSVITNIPSAANAIYVYAPVVFEVNALEQLTTLPQGITVQDISLVYRVALSDGSTVYIDAQPAISGTPQPALLLSQLFPYAQVLEVYTVSYEGRELRALALDNGFAVVTNPADGTIVYIIHTASANPAQGGFRATPIPIITATPTATHTWTATPSASP